MRGVQGQQCLHKCSCFEAVHTRKFFICNSDAQSPMDSDDGMQEDIQDMEHGLALAPTEMMA